LTLRTLLATYPKSPARGTGKGSFENNSLMPIGGATAPSSRMISF